MKLSISPKSSMFVYPKISSRRLGWHHKIVLVILLLACSLVAKGVYLQGRAIVAQQLLTFAWARHLLDGEEYKAWPWADSSPIAQLSIAGQAPLIVLDGATGSNLAFAPARMAGSSPFGQIGNSVVVAHNDTHFKQLENVQTGSYLTLEIYPHLQLDYQVIAIKIVHERELSVLDVNDQELLTLLTCYPFTSSITGSELRFVVVAKRIKKPFSDMDLAWLDNAEG